VHLAATEAAAAEHGRGDRVELVEVAEIALPMSKMKSIPPRPASVLQAT
jgi:hypothetical protein